MGAKKEKFIDITWSHIRISQALMDDINITKAKVTIEGNRIIITRSNATDAVRIYRKPNRSGSIENIDVLCDLYEAFDFLEWDENKFFDIAVHKDKCICIIKNKEKQI